MYYFIVLFILNTLLPSNTIESSELQLQNKKVKNWQLYNSLPDTLRSKPVTYVRSQIQQEDKFSCGHRTLFHALCIQWAMNKEKYKNAPFDQSLPQLLRNEKQLERIYKKIQSSCTGTYSEWDQLNGLTAKQMMDICQTLMPALTEKFIPVYCMEDGQLLVWDICNKKKPLIFPKNFLLRDTDLDFSVLLENSPILHYQLKKLEEPFGTAYFACLIDFHWILASMISTKNKQIKFFIMDSSNSGIRENDVCHRLIKKFLPYVQAINARNRFRSLKILSNQIEESAAERR